MRTQYHRHSMGTQCYTTRWGNLIYVSVCYTTRWGNLTYVSVCYTTRWGNLIYVSVYDVPSPNKTLRS